jgi:hypothetical protein
MIYITQLIYIREGQEYVFHQFENIAIPIISKYNGKLLLRIHPSQENIVAGAMDCPYEIHFISFETGQDFENFMKDEERKKFLHLKEQSIRLSLLVKGEQL